VPQLLLALGETLNTTQIGVAMALVGVLLAAAAATPGGSITYVTSDAPPQ
jgi:hypothetical protein